MSEVKTKQEIFPRVRRLSSLGSLRREIIRTYDRARTDKPEKIGFYRGLGYLLSAAIDARKAEMLEDIEMRLRALEQDVKDGKTHERS